MYRVIDTVTGKDCIILDPIWNRDTIHKLRAQDRVNRLCCPHCNKPVRLRAGEKKRWHFAHKDLSDCSLRNESAEILEARSQLYSLLKSKFGDDVTVEKSIDGVNLPRPIDCVIEHDGQKIGYWIFERGLRNRSDLQRKFAENNIKSVWIFLHTMQDRDEEESQVVHLTPTERDFLFISDYNRLYSSSDRSGLYLDHVHQKMITLRGLICIHEPQKYEFDHLLEHDLSEMLVLPSTGEFIHPGEYQAFQQWKERQKQEEKLRQRQQEEQKKLLKLEEERRLKYMKDLERKMAHQQSSRPVFSNKYVHVKPGKKERKSPKSSIAEKGISVEQESYPCEVCGAMAKDWVVLDHKTKTCVCSRECLKTKRIQGAL
jgi:hypothetical protein